MNSSSSKWAILIGINRYHESLGPLKYAVNDCRRVGEVLMQGEDGFPAGHVLLVTDDQPEDRRPTYANIHSWLASWLSQPKENDTVFVYFSGHGRELGGKCYLAPGDATLQTMHVTGIPVTHVQDILARCKAKQKILVLDACHSGAGKDVAAMSGSMIDQIAAGKGIYTITSCDADELSHEWDEKKQGVFSYYLAEALSGACPPDAQGRVTAESLYEWVYDRVRFWAAKRRCTQNPKRFCDAIGRVVVWLRASPPQEDPVRERASARPLTRDIGAVLRDPLVLAFAVVILPIAGLAAFVVWQVLLLVRALRKGRKSRSLARAAFASLVWVIKIPVWGIYSCIVALVEGLVWDRDRFEVMGVKREIWNSIWGAQALVATTVVRQAQAGIRCAAIGACDAAVSWSIRVERHLGDGIPAETLWGNPWEIEPYDTRVRKPVCGLSVVMGLWWWLALIF